MQINPQGQTIEETYTDKKEHWQLSNFDPGNRVTFDLDGFVSKTYSSGNLPQLVRLLEDKLIGYQKRLWFVPGENVEIFVHAPTAYVAGLYRHGLVKECILDLGLFNAQTQTVPDGYFVETGLDWMMSFTYTIPQDAKPGIYSLLLESAGQEPFAIPMVVSTPKERYGENSKLLVLASTTTWQSYNIWGGRSRYRSFEGKASKDFVDLKSPKHRVKAKIAKTFPINLKATIRHILRYWLKTEAFCYKRLSILRPFTNCDLEENDVFQPFTNHLASGEWRLLAWLESEKIDYDILSGAELHREPDLLKNYKAIILSTHCEYWSREMYEGLKYYHENNGLWILNISGNTMYREIEFFEDGSTRCVSLSFAHSCADETQLVGVRFTEDDLGTCAPYRVIEPDHWAFENSSVKKNQSFGEVSLNQNTPKEYLRYNPGRPGDSNGLLGIGASGWETDKLSKTAPTDIAIIAKGMNKNGGADMVIREPSLYGGGMFSASSITFSGCLLADSTASNLVRNILSKALVAEHSNNLSSR